MVPASFFTRLPSSTILLVLSTLVSPTTSHSLPQETKTIDPRHIRPWPLTPTQAPVSPLDRRRGRLNTVCGYIGGSPDLPATCLAGSHCAVDVEHGAIGCCPNGGGCTRGIFTGCVDHNSEPQTAADPYVFTCSSKDVCYKNTFDGGYFQYGCGSTSDLATRVAMTASGQPDLDLVHMSVDLTATPTPLPGATTIGSLPATASGSIHVEGGDMTVQSTSMSSHSTAPTDAVAAPSSGGSTKNTGAIIGGVIGGVALLVLLLVLGFCMWRRKKANARRGPGPNQETQYIRSPMSENRHTFEPLSSTQEVHETAMPRNLPLAHAVTTDGVSNDDSRAGAASFRPNYPYGYGPGSTAGGIGAVRGGHRHASSTPMESDRVPLTTEIDEFSQGFNTALGDIRDDDHAPRPNANTMGSYPGRRRDGESPLWQQNRRRSRNLMWM